MPASQADVPTNRAGRYLAQLCGHGARMTSLTLRGGHGHGGGVASTPRHAEWSETDGVIEFDRGRCTLHATGDGLLLRVEADDQQQLRRIQDAVAARLERIGRRDALTVTWRPTPPAPSTDACAP
ncbi:DUF2218 domain-containing protein [Actinoallomurus liliacearum]|uniref:DUF2218 domain-containing protein n=1 Tax=Actinoallomurus liliacearum TaxID=1080073 RepID=A0ABP8TF90_9ACTN